MTDIKVGQIWQSRESGNICCISAIGKEEFFIISPEGSAFKFPKYVLINVVKTSRLLKEYDTWEEAVNSKEFNK